MQKIENLKNERFEDSGVRDLKPYMDFSMGNGKGEKRWFSEKAQWIEYGQESLV
jgi:hypothetical protein